MFLHTCLWQALTDIGSNKHLEFYKITLVRRGQSGHLYRYMGIDILILLCILLYEYGYRYLCIDILILLWLLLYEYVYCYMSMFIVI